jgi:ABC-type glycerol-3-phosphate transport system substrate-binding protein
MADLLPMARALYTADGAVRALPLGLATYVLYYNSDWSRDLGYDAEEATLTGLREAACAATNVEGGQLGLGIPSQPGVFLSLLATGGSSLSDAAGSLRLSQEATVNAGNVMRALFDEGCGALFEVPRESVQQFGTSTLAFLGGSTLQRARVEATVAAESNFSPAVAPLPGLQEAGVSLWYGPGLLLLAPPGPRRDAALEVMGWLMEPEAQIAWDEATQYLPVRRSLVAQRLAEEGDLRPIESGLLDLALSAADEGRWGVLPASAMSDADCRTALVRGMLDLSRGQSAEEVLQRVGQVCDEEAPP